MIIPASSRSANSIARKTSTSSSKRAAKPFLLTASTLLASTLICIPAYADAYTSLTTSSGPDGYRSRDLYADADLFDLPLSLNLDYFVGSSSGTNDTTQTMLGFEWEASSMLALKYHHAVTDDGRLLITGNDAAIALSFGESGTSELLTSFDLGYGKNIYESTQTTKTLEQQQYTLGFSQDLTSSFSLYGSHDEYHYSRDPTSLALALIVLTRNNAKSAYTLLGFPEKSNSLGVNWKATENLTLDLSGSRSTTKLEQVQKNVRLGADYKVSDNINIAAAVSRSSTSELYGPNGHILLMEATQGTYTELAFGLAF